MRTAAGCLLLVWKAVCVRNTLEALQAPPEEHSKQMHANTCLCRCPGVGKWVENDEESRQAFKGAAGVGLKGLALSSPAGYLVGWAGPYTASTLTGVCLQDTIASSAPHSSCCLLPSTSPTPAAERTQKRLDEIVRMGWQEHTHTASAALTSTAGGTVSVGTATAAHSHSSGGEKHTEVAGRARRTAAQQAPTRSGPPPRRLPADIRQELEAIQQRQQGPAAGQAAGQAAAQQGQSASCGMALPPLSGQRRPQGAAAAAAGADTQQQQQQAPSSSRRTSHSRLQAAGRAAAGQHVHKHSHKHSHHHPHEHSAQHGHEHHHTCSHPHEDCTSDCCSAPTVAAQPGGAGAGADPLLLAQQPGLAALAAALTSSGPGASSPAAAAAAVGLGAGASSDLLRLWEQMAASWPPGSVPAAAAAVPPPAAALPLLPPLAASASLPMPPPMPVLTVARAPPELPAEGG